MNVTKENALTEDRVEALAELLPDLYATAHSAKTGWIVDHPEYEFLQWVLRWVAASRQLAADARARELAEDAATPNQLELFRWLDLKVVQPLDQLHQDIAQLRDQLATTTIRTEAHSRTLNDLRLQVFNGTDQVQGNGPG